LHMLAAMTRRRQSKRKKMVVYQVPGDD